MKRLTTGVLLVALLGLAVPTSASAVSYATNVRLGNHPRMYVRTVIDFPAWAHPEGDRNSALGWWQYWVRDDRMSDGRGVMRIKAATFHPWQRVWRVTRRGYGLTVRATRVDDRVRGWPYLQVELLSKPGTLTRYTWTSIGGRRAVIDSWIAGRS